MYPPVRVVSSANRRHLVMASMGVTFSTLFNAARYVRSVSPSAAAARTSLADASTSEAASLIKTDVASACSEAFLQRAGGWNERQRAFHGALDQHSRNQQAVDFVCPLENTIHARVAIVPLGRVILHEAVAAMYLDVLVEHIVECFAAGDLGDGGFDRELLHRCESRVVAPLLQDRRIDQPGGSVQETLDGISPRG